MAKAIRLHQTGGPEVLRLETVEVGEPGPGEIRIRHHACGLNFIDVYFRTGLYPLALRPAWPARACAADRRHPLRTGRLPQPAQSIHPANDPPRTQPSKS